jgi:hypothetical protein
MHLYQAERGEIGVNRRISSRFRIEIPVQVRLPSGIKHGKLSDISEGGAKIMLQSPPAQGATVLLAWSEYEVFCKVMWVTDTSCGLKFERAIPQAVVLATIGQDNLDPMGPSANRNNIPMGQKRVRPGSSA